MSFTFTPIFSDTFVRANEEPLNPANWTNVLSQPGSSLSVLSDACAADASINDGYEVCVGATFPADQYAEAIIGAYSNASPNEGSSVPVVVRGSSSSSTSGYSFTVFGNGDGTSKLQLFGGNIGGGVGLTQVLAHVNTGDKIRIEAIGITITGLYNGVVIFTANDSTYATGLPGLEVQYDLVHTDTTVTLFTAGSIKTVESSPLLGSWNEYQRLHYPPRPVQPAQPVPTSGRVPAFYPTRKTFLNKKRPLS